MLTPFNEINHIPKKYETLSGGSQGSDLRTGLMQVQNLASIKDFLQSFLIHFNLCIVESGSPLRRKLSHCSFEIRRHHSN